MTTAQTVLDQYAALAGTSRQPAWLAELRQQALEQARTRGLPSKRVEAWHYSAIDQWLAQSLEQHGSGLTLPDDAIDASISEHLPGLVFTFSHGYLSGESDEVHRIEGVEFKALAHLDEKKDAELIAWLAARNDDPLASLVDALAPEAWVLSISAEAQLKQPLVLHHQASQPGVHMPRIIVRLEAGARATVVEHFSGYQGCNYLTLSRTALQVGRDARLSYVRVNRDGNDGQHVGLTQLEQAQGSHVKLQALAVNGARVRNGLNIDLVGSDAQFECSGAFAGSGQQHLDYHIAINHLADRGVSRTRFQGLAGEQARGVMNGRVYIAKDTHGNDGQLSTHNLLLSDNAEIDAKPELEIYADDVSCAHGATVGQLDADQLLYLRTRGISRADAIALLTEGFLRSGVMNLGSTLNDYLEQQLSGALTRIDTEQIAL